MGFLDAIFGGQRKLKPPAESRLFAMSTAYIAIETELGMKHRNAAGLVFQPLDTADFQGIVAEAQELLASAAADTGTRVETADDEFGYRWVILRDDDFDDLVVALNTVSSQLESGGYGDRLLATVFAFEQKGRPVYFIYNFKRGRFYPFVPAGDKKRDNEAEMRLKAQLEKELPIEPELERWFPLWEIPI